MSSPFFGFPPPRTIGAGINPGAPDPQQQVYGPPVPQGPGLGLQAEAAPAAPQPQMQLPQQDPDDLSDLNPLSKMGLVLGNVAAGLQGNMANSPVAMLQQQRRAAYERKRGQFLQGVQLMEKFNADLEKVPLSQRAAKKAGQRQVMVQWAGKGGGELYDAFMADDGRIEAMLKAAPNDPGLQALIAMDPTPERLANYATDPNTLQRWVDDNDQKQLDPLVAKFESLRNDPKARAEAEKLLKDGMTVADIRTLNDKYGTDGPGGNRLTQADLGVLGRQQGELISKISGFKTDAEFMKDRERQANEESDIRKERAKQQAELEFNTSLNKGGPQISPAMRDFLKVEHKEAVQAIANTDSALDYLKELDRALNKAEAVLTDKPVDSDLPVKRGKIDVSDASDKRVNTGKTRFIPGMGLGQSITNTDDYSILEQAYGEEWVGKIRTSAPKGAFSDKEGVALERTIGGFGKGNHFNLRDIRERRQFIAELRERKIEERRQATEKRASIAKRVEADDLGTSVTREGGSTGGAAPGEGGGDDVKEIKVNGQWVKARRVNGGWEPVQ